MKTIGVTTLLKVGGTTHQGGVCIYIYIFMYHNSYFSSYIYKYEWREMKHNFYHSINWSTVDDSKVMTLGRATTMRCSNTLGLRLTNNWNMQLFNVIKIWIAWNCTYIFGTIVIRNISINNSTVCNFVPIILFEAIVKFSDIIWRRGSQESGWLTKMSSLKWRDRSILSYVMRKNSSWT